MALTPHPALASLHALGLLTTAELEEAIAELDIAAHERLHPPEDDIDMPELALDAGLVNTVAWLLYTDLLPKNEFLQRVAALPRQYQGAALQERQQLASAGVQQHNRMAVGTLYEENLLDQFQRDAAYAAVPGDQLIVSPAIAMRWMVAQHLLSAQQLQAVELRTSTHGTELGRMIMDTARLQPYHVHKPYQRPPAWKGALIVLGLIAVISLISLAWRTLSGEPPTAKARQGAQSGR